MAKTPLDEYSKKRAFDATPEPAPALARRSRAASARPARRRLVRPVQN